LETLFEFLKDFDVRLLAPIATICAIVVSILLWRLNQRNKSLTFEILSRHPLVNVRGAARRGLEVRYEGRHVEDAELILLRIWNNGHIPVNAGEFLSNLVIKLNPTAEVIAAGITETVPGNLEDRSKSKQLISCAEGERVEITPVLLNPEDSLTVQLLVRRAVGRLAVEGHVQGIARIEVYKYRNLIPRTLTQIGALVMAGGMLLVDPTDIRSYGFEHLLPCILIFATGYVLLHSGLYWPGKHKDDKDSSSVFSA
jgi:hypothetical protein